MYPTKNSLPEKTRGALILLLQQHLADSIDLALQTKQAHWNVKGPDFIALHQLFDKVAEDVEDYVDMIAERIVQLGGVALGTLESLSGKTNLPVYSLTISGGREHVAALSHALASYGETIRNSIARVSEMEDAGTADLLTEISRGADKWLWFVEAHGQSEH